MSKTRPLSHERGTEADPKWGKRWQLCKMCSTLITAVCGLRFRVERPTPYIPIVSSQIWMGVNQCTYARGWGKLPRCEGSAKRTRISAMHKPTCHIEIVSKICDDNRDVHTMQSALLAIKVCIFDYQCSVKTSRWQPLPRAFVVVWSRVNCLLALAITDMRLWREHNMNRVVDIEAIIFIR